MVMWILIFERLWFFRFSKPQLIQDAREQWDQVRSENGGPGRKSWEGHMIRSMLISQASSSINSNIDLIKVCTAVAPLVGLFGTIIGMINTFQAITLFGTGDPKTMASGISEALVTTWLGLMCAIPSVFMAAILANYSKGILSIIEEQSTGMVAARSEGKA